MAKYENPLTYAEAIDYAETLQELLRSLDREIVLAALVGQSQRNLLDTEREEMDRICEFLDGRVLMPLKLDGFRGRGLALLDAFKNELLTGMHDVSPSVSDSNLPEGESK